MATAAPISKASLIADARKQWTHSEASVAKAAKGNFEATPASGEWSAGNCYRHLIDTMHKMPDAIDQLVKAQPLTALSAGDEVGIKSFATLNAKMLPIELNTAHGIVWMALQKLTDRDLEKQVALGDHKMTLGAALQVFLIGHEQSHVEQALKSAGVS